MLPKGIRDRIWAGYRSGQEDDGKLSREYVVAFAEARLWIEKHHPSAALSLPGLTDPEEPTNAKP